MTTNVVKMKGCVAADKNGMVHFYKTAKKNIEFDTSINEYMYVGINMDTKFFELGKAKKADFNHTDGVIPVILTLAYDLNIKRNTAAEIMKSVLPNKTKAAKKIKKECKRLLAPEKTKRGRPVVEKKVARKKKDKPARQTKAVQTPTPKVVKVKKEKKVEKKVRKLIRR